MAADYGKLIPESVNNFVCWEYFQSLPYGQNLFKVSIQMTIWLILNKYKFLIAFIANFGSFLGGLVSTW